MIAISANDSRLRYFVPLHPFAAKPNRG